MKNVLDQILESSPEEIDKLVEDTDFNIDEPLKEDAPEPDPFSETDSSIDKDAMKEFEKNAKSNDNDDDFSEASLTEDELMSIYSECVSEVIRESKAKIAAKYKSKREQAKRFKRKKLAAKNKAMKPTKKDGKKDDVDFEETALLESELNNLLTF